MVGASFGGGEGEAGGLMGMGTGGVLPSSSCWSVRMDCILLGGASWTPVMASVRECEVATILSVNVMVGTGMVWCLKQNVLVRRSLPVPSMIVRMH